MCGLWLALQVPSILECSMHDFYTTKHISPSSTSSSLSLLSLHCFFFELMVAWKLFGNVFVVQVVDCYKYDFVIKSVVQLPSFYV